VSESFARGGFVSCVAVPRALMVRVFSLNFRNDNNRLID
tara:strand:- start:299 stop:415 length:117 start_codon:yes stop_codon:yes gene_type:complete